MALQVPAPSPPRTTRPRRAVAAAAVALGLLLLASLVLYARGGGPGVLGWLGFLRPEAVSPLARSGPEEQFLRVVYQAGYGRAAVGRSGPSAVARVEIPAVNTPADLEIAWQTAAAGLSSAYPNAADYTVQVFDTSGALLEIGWEGPTVREAVAADDARPLRDASRIALPVVDGSASAGPGPDSRASGFFAYIARGVRGVPAPARTVPPEPEASLARRLRDAQPGGTVPLPPGAVSVDVEVPGAYLAEKNRAVGLGEAGSRFASDGPLAEYADAMRASGAGIPALQPGVDAGRYWAAQAASALEGVPDRAVGLGALRAELEGVEAGLDQAAIMRVRSVAMALLALRAPVSGSVLAAVREAAAIAAQAPPDDADSRAAVLAALGSPRAPETAVRVEAFERAEALDVAGGTSAEASTVPGAVLALWDGPGVQYVDGGERSTADPDTWLGYRRADGRAYWLAGEGGRVALTDATLAGWAHREYRAAVVRADSVGEILAYYRTR